MSSCDSPPTYLLGNQLHSPLVVLIYFLLVDINLEDEAVFEALSHLAGNSTPELDGMNANTFEKHVQRYIRDV